MKELPNIICNQSDQASPLHFAVLSNQLESVRILLQFGGNPNQKDSLGNTPLHYAVAK